MSIDMEFVVQTCRTIVLVLYYWILAFVKTFLPQVKTVSGEKVLITGAGSGIGREMAIRFAKLGSHVLLLDVDSTSNAETERLVQEVGAAVNTYSCDLTSRENIYTTLKQLKQDVGDVDILINNAGIVTGRKLLDSPDDLIQKTMDVNIMAHFWLIKSVLPSMLTRNHGHVVTIASSGGSFGVTGLADYCASKFAAVGLADSITMEIDHLGKSGVKVTTICPYFINTGMFDGVVTTFPRLLGILDKDDAVDRIMNAILTDQAVLYMPRFLYLALFLKGMLPVKCALLLSSYFGIDQAMQNFRGRNKQD